MNVEALMGMSGAMPQQQGAIVSEEGTPGSFSQILKALVAEVDVQGSQEVNVSNGSPNWFGVLLSLFGQHAAGYESALDPTGEASSLTQDEASASLTQDETSVSLTELITALQPLVDQDLAASLFEQDGETNSVEAVDPITVEAVDDATDIATLNGLLSLLSATLPLSPAVLDQLASGNLTEAEIVARAVNTLPANAAPVIPVAGNATDGNPQAPLPAAAEAVARAGNNATESQQASFPAKTTAPETSETGKMPTATATQSATTADFARSLVGLKPSANNSYSSVEVAGDTSVQPAIEPQVELPSSAAQPAVSVDASGTSSASQVVASEPLVQAAPELPNIPALHQVVDSARLITRQGETQVRLHLHPESLGQVLVQMHVVDGDVSVRMLAETLQAQTLLQDHLPQLKAAFAAQGLQANGLTIELGSDASAFDTPDHQTNDSGANDSPYSQADNALFDDTGQSPTTRPTLSMLGGLHSVDYQV
jgi:flagellar hook-length control protein FliK